MVLHINMGMHALPNKMPFFVTHSTSPYRQRAQGMISPCP